MKILYIGVHSHQNWGAEFWLVRAFYDLDIEYDLLDFRNELKTLSNHQINEIIYLKSKTCNVIFLQRGNHLSPQIFNDIKTPLVFWSTEPIQLKHDVDRLLNSNIFSWVFVHSYSCMKRIQDEFPHLISKTSVLHNAAPKEKIHFTDKKNIFSIFNRSLSWRRRFWLFPSRRSVKIIKGVYGNDYFNNLRSAEIAINIHYSRKNLDDFESGIFEAMASGCLVISEKLNKQTLIDLDMKNAIIQIESPFDLNKKLQYLEKRPEIIKSYQKKVKHAICKNTWHDRAKIMKYKFEEVRGK